MNNLSPVWWFTSWKRQLLCKLDTMDRTFGIDFFVQVVYITQVLLLFSLSFFLLWNYLFNIKYCVLPYYIDVVATFCYYAVQAPVPLSIFRSNSKFDENSECSSFEYTRLITTIFCTRHDSDTVVTCAKYRCDRPRIFYTGVFWIFIEFRIRSKYA